MPEPSTVILHLSVSTDLLPYLTPDQVDELLQALDNFEPVLDTIGEFAAIYEAQNYQDQGETFGSPWAPLAQSTVRGKLSAGYPATPLVRTGNEWGHMGTAVVMTPTSILVGVDASQVPQARYQQGGTSRMPARIIAAVTDDMVETFMQIVQQWLADRVGAAAEAITISAEAV